MKATFEITGLHQGQNADWFEVWKRKCENADVVIVIFSGIYQDRFTKALLREATLIMELEQQGKVRVFIFDPRKCDAAVIRDNLEEDAEFMGDLPRWKNFVTSTSPISLDDDGNIVSTLERGSGGGAFVPGLPPGCNQTEQKAQPQPNPTGPMNRDDLRKEFWYPRYCQSVTDTIARVGRKYPQANIKILGVQGGNHDVRPLLEFTCLQEDICRARARQEKTGKKQFQEPEFHSVKFAYVREVIDKANEDENKTQLIVASCPSRIGDDERIMQQVEEMIGTSKAVTICYSI